MNKLFTQLNEKFTNLGEKCDEFLAPLAEKMDDLFKKLYRKSYESFCPKAKK